MNVTKKRSPYAAMTAELCDCTPRYVRMVINGERENEKVFETYMALAQGTNTLVNAVKNLNLFNEPAHTTTTSNQGINI